uniref:Uncharacterized protein n=1 Tax=Kalanchoe fedtschenkoi TaxID=63787 RepID=A0A7N0ZX11_KALFE
MTWEILYQLIFYSTFGATVNVFLYFIGLEYTTSTIAYTADNTFPAITYIIGISVGTEKLKIRERAGPAKVFKTTVRPRWAMVLSFYHGPRLHVTQPGIHWTFVNATAKEGSDSGHSSMFLDLCWLSAAMCLGLFGSWFGQDLTPYLFVEPNGYEIPPYIFTWLVLCLRTKMSQNYIVPFTNTTLMCFWFIFPSVLVSGIMNGKSVDRSLKSPIRLVSVLYGVHVSNISHY